MELTPNTTAQYNLGSLYAQGRGTDRDFLQAAYWFHQAAVNGDSSAEKLLAKSTIDYLEQDLSGIMPYGLYQKIQRYLLLLYPKKDGNPIAGETLYSLAVHHFNKKEYEGEADNGVGASKKDRDGILNAYFENSSPEEFFDIMETLAKACINGTIDIPQDNEKAKYWRSQCEKLNRASM